MPPTSSNPSLPPSQTTVCSPNATRAPEGLDSSKGGRTISVHDCRKELNEINARHSEGLAFMQQEFHRLEQELVPDNSSDEAAVTRHGRLVYFIRHLEQTTTQLHELEGLVGDAETLLGSSISEHDEPGADGSSVYWAGQLDRLVKLRRHIEESLLPIKSRLEAQLYGSKPANRSNEPIVASSAAPQSQQQPVGTSPSGNTSTSVSQQPGVDSKPLASSSELQNHQSEPSDTLFGSGDDLSLEGATARPLPANGLSQTPVFPSSASPLSGSSSSPMPQRSGYDAAASMPPPLPHDFNLQQQPHHQAVKREFDVETGGGLDELREWEMATGLGNVDDAAAGALSLASGHRSPLATSSARAEVVGWPPPATGQGGGRKRFRSSFEDDDTKAMEALTAPKPVEYQCSICTEPYPSTSNLNPWWAITKELCPKCEKLQIPRIDISEPANTIDYHPALLRASAVESGVVEAELLGEEEGVGMGGASDVSAPATPGAGGGGVAVGYGASGGGGRPLGLGDVEPGRLGAGSAPGVTAGNSGGDDVHDHDGELDADGMLGDGEHRLPTSQAAKLLVLIAHARTCPGHHLSRSHSEVCKSVKYLMLHIRDCCGKLPDGSECGFPWCRPCKYLIHHLVKCQKPDKCPVCSPCDLPPALSKLRGLNQLREGGGGCPAGTASSNNGGNENRN